MLLPEHPWKVAKSQKSQSRNLVIVIIIIAIIIIITRWDGEDLEESGYPGGFLHAPISRRGSRRSSRYSRWGPLKVLLKLSSFGTDHSHFWLWVKIVLYLHFQRSSASAIPTLGLLTCKTKSEVLPLENERSVSNLELFRFLVTNQFSQR